MSASRNCFAAFLHDQEGGAADGADQHRAEEERHGAADKEADEHHRVGDGELAGLGHILGGGHLADLVFAAHGDDRDEAGEERDGGDDRGADRDALGLGLGRVAHGVEVGEDLAGALVAALLLFLHRLGVVAHFADAVGVVGHGTEHVHRDGVAGQREHADAGHGHAIGDEERRGARVAEVGEEDGDGDDDHHGDRAFIADRKALDDVGGVARLAGFREALHRRMRGVGVIARHLVQRDREDDADEAGDDRAHVEAGDAEVGPDRQTGRIAIGEAGGGRLRSSQRYAASNLR